MSEPERSDSDEEPKVFTARPKPSRRKRVVTPPPAQRRQEGPAEGTGTEEAPAG